MKVQTIPIAHRIKHLQPIFTITKGSNQFASGGVNGEMKLWDSLYNPIKTIKKHVGSVTCVRFSLDGNFLASAGDDGKIYIFNSNHDIIKTIKHSCDVTHLEWTPNFLISSDLDGYVLITKISDFSEFKKLKNHDQSILGITISSDFRYLCSYSQDKIIIYDDFNIKSEKLIEKGVILENLNSKISFSPNNKFISVGLQFNKKRPTVDILDLNLENLFSLVGHAAPTEITCFCPFSFKKIQKFYILAIASQDLSISFWNTMNPKPFLLLKNFTESPVLDMFWDNLVLYVSSYDGIVKTITFDESEFGEKVENDVSDQEFDLPFNEKNIEMQKNYEKRIEKLDFTENIEIMKLVPFTVSTGLTVSEAIKENEMANKVSEIESIKSKMNESSGFILESSDLSKSLNEPNANHLNETNANTESTLNSNIESTLNAIVPPLQIQNKPKRITPVMIDKPKSAPIISRKDNNFVVLYDTKQPEKLKMIKSTPFKTFLNDFSIELKDDGAVIINRANRSFYKINGPCYKVCFNQHFLAIYTTHVQIYDLTTGCLILPFIFIKLSYFDILDSKLLILDLYGDFTIIDLLKKKSISGKLAKTKDLSKIQLSKTHFLVAEYGNEIVFYNKKMKIWLSVNPNFNSITTSGVDFLNDNDDTMAELELCFVHYALVEDDKNMMATLKQFISLIKRKKKLEEFVEYKIEKMLSHVKNVKILELILEELNREMFLQRFVFKMCRKFEIFNLISK